jgi:hypothetical protein
MYSTVIFRSVLNVYYVRGIFCLLWHSVLSTAALGPLHSLRSSDTDFTPLTLLRLNVIYPSVDSFESIERLLRINRAITLRHPTRWERLLKEGGLDEIS